jgi:hypothetical protein
VTVDANLLSEAIVVWTGHGKAAWPSRDPESLVAAWGAELAQELLPAVLLADREFWDSDAHFRVAELALMGEVAAERFRALRPELSEAAVRALAWCYTFDNK